MGKLLDLVGKRFGKMVVIRFDRMERNHSFWEFRCDCGKIAIHDGAKIVRAQKIHGVVGCSYGCAHKLPDGEAMFNIIFNRYVRGAFDRDLCFELTRDFFKRLIVQNCFYCKRPPSQTSLKHHPTILTDFIHNGVDRINNNVGYIEDNCVPCCTSCNRAKVNLGYGEFLEWLEWIRKSVRQI